MNIEQNNDHICEICGRPKNEYDSSWSCKKNHDWRGWIKHTDTIKFKKYQINHKISVEKALRRKLEELNKKTPEVYKNRNLRKLRRGFKKFLT
jgi:hypothetical protein